MFARNSIGMSVELMDLDDLVAGLFLCAFGILGIALYAIVCWSMSRMCREIVGFRFLLSQSAADILLMFQFAIWPGIVILAQAELIPPHYRWHLHMYLDFTWWAMVYHYPVVAWSRLAAVQWPNWFRCLPYSTCIWICSPAWILGFVQSVVEHQFQWFEPLYYDPTLYGLTSNWREYKGNGTAAYYMVFNITSMILPFPFYGLALYALLRRQKKQLVEPSANCRIRGNSLTPSIILQRQLSIETRLIVPCIINTILFVFGQVFVTLCSNFSGKWITWCVIVLFATNSFVNPIIYLTFSSAIRRHLFKDCKKRLSNSLVYKEYEYRSSSGSGPSTQQRTSLVRWKKDSSSVN